jgi:hypothetical protein
MIGGAGSRSKETKWAEMCVSKMIGGADSRRKKSKEKVHVIGEAGGGGEAKIRAPMVHGQSDRITAK